MDEQQIAHYEELVGPVRDRYRQDFAQAEARWVARRQAVIDRVEAAVPGAALAHDGLIDFLSDGLDEAHERAVGALLETYQAAAQATRREVESA